MGKFKYIAIFSTGWITFIMYKLEKQINNIHNQYIGDIFFQQLNLRDI